MDLSMPGIDGIGAIQQICRTNPAARIVVLTSFPDRTRVSAALDAGACGYLLKDAQPVAIADAVRSAAAGDSPVDPRVAANLIADRRTVDASVLTAREQEVLKLVGKGMLNKQIARELDISEKTVKAHLGRIFNRLGVPDRTQAALWAERQGLLDE
jgi:DNA-binding NarL/FixJ family response regulator